MFRLDFLDDRSPIDTVAEVTHAQTARRLAVQAAKHLGRDVLIVRTGSGTPERATLVVRADGTFASPPGSLSTCKRDEGTGPCFCPACRAVRKAERAAR